jgi:hypothetical protein
VLIFCNFDILNRVIEEASKAAGEGNLQWALQLTDIILDCRTCTKVYYMNIAELQRRGTCSGLCTEHLLIILNYSVYSKAYWHYAVLYNTEIGKYLYHVTNLSGTFLVNVFKKVKNQPTMQANRMEYRYTTQYVSHTDISHYRLFFEFFLLYSVRLCSFRIGRQRSLPMK